MLLLFYQFGRRCSEIRALHPSEIYDYLLEYGTLVHEAEAQRVSSGRAEVEFGLAHYYACRLPRPEFALVVAVEVHDLLLSSVDAYGIAHNRCVDGELMKRLFADDKEFVHYLNADMTLKDKGQRKACGCMVSKDIGMYDTCRHFCVYCYANSGKESVLKNALRHSDEGESLIER